VTRPVSALDVSIQAQVLNLIRDLQERLGVGFIFITHDLAVVSEIADVIAVMYLGRVIETGTREEVLGNPQHPYTQALLSAAPGLRASPNASCCKGSPRRH
jgi:ABC-type dipeptide/oligopeptide/nickel transport system ATPase component